MRSGPTHRAPERPTTRALARALCACLAAIGLLASSATASAKVPAEFFGIDAEIPTSGDYPDMHDAGFRSFRVAITWAAAQPTADSPYNWAEADARIYDVESNGMTPVVGLAGAPDFVHPPSDQGNYAPTSKDDLQAWQDFNQAVAERYGPDGDFYDLHPELADHAVHTWIMWNEENSKNNWQPKVDPKGYAKLVKSGQQGITAADPSAEISLGGMYGYPQDPKSMYARDFLAKFYKVPGIANYFDAISSHPYGPDVKAVKKQVKELRSVASKAGDPKVGLYVGELGWASDGPARSEEVVGRKGQADRLEDGLNLLITNRKAWKVRGVFIYTWRDFPDGTLDCSWCAWAGLVEMNGDPKPALKRVEKVIAKQT